MNVFREVWFNTGNCLADRFRIPEARRLQYYSLPLIPALARWPAGAGEWLRLSSDEPTFIGQVIYLLVYTTMTFLTFNHFLPWIIFMFGKLVSGVGLQKDIRLVVQISCIPYVLVVGFYLMESLIPGDQLNRSPIFEFLAWIFAIRIMVIGIARVQKLTYLFAAVNLCLPSIIVTVLYLLIRSY